MRKINRMLGAVALAVVILTSSAMAGNMPCVVEPPPPSQTSSSGGTCGNMPCAVSDPQGDSAEAAADEAAQEVDLGWFMGLLTDGANLLLSVF